MPVSLGYYVNITSGVGAGEVLPERQLIPMIFDDNALIPSGGFVNFPNNGDAAANVAAYFGSSSDEYKRALFAFGWISKNIRTVPSISFGRWNSVACAPVIFGDRAATQSSVSSWALISSGSFSLTMGSHSHTFTGLDFSAVTSLTDVANIVQGAIQAQTGGGALWTGATVSYNAPSGRFQLLGGATGAAVISVTAGVSNDIAGSLGWLSVLTIFGPGAGIQTITDLLIGMNTLNNNFGSFAFMTTLNTSQIVEAATVNNAFNEVYMYSIPATASTASTISTAVTDIGGCTITLLHPTLTQFEEQIPMMILAATQYESANSTQNYMFQQFDVVPSVTDTTTAEAYDAIGVNYYANTQQAGQVVSLYQRGQMQGLPVDAAMQNTYSNEIWLKGAMQSALMTLLLALSKISANNMGQSQVLAICQDVIQRALNNGVISVGRTLSPQQILFITNATNDPLAWKQVQNIGYWIATTITSMVVDDHTEYAINYTLIYAQDAVVNKINGTDILI